MRSARPSVPAATLLICCNPGGHTCEPGQQIMETRIIPLASRPRVVSGIFFVLLVCSTAQGQQTQYPRAIPLQTPLPATTAAAAPVAAAVPAPRVEVNDVACFIAGLPVTSGPLAALEQTPEWTSYAASLNARWAQLDTQRLQPIRLWTADAIAPLNTQRLFYPFSGPDFIYAATMFPNANTYILCGLEPVGTVPDINNLQPIDATLGWLQASVKTLIEAGYFVTKDMKVELNASPLKGTLPLICVMLVRLGDHITSIKSDSSHAEIHFVTPAGGPERTVFYFSADLSNGGMGKRSAFLNFLRQARPDTAYVKSASYLMHGDELSAVRNFLLTEY